MSLKNSWPIPTWPAMNCPRLRCHGYKLFCRLICAGEFFLQRLGTSLAEFRLPLFQLFRICAILAGLFGCTFIFNFWFKPWCVARLLNSREVFP